MTNLRPWAARRPASLREEMPYRPCCRADRWTLGHLVRPLEKRGLVKLEVSERDRRSRMVALTQTGRAAAAKARPRWAAAQRQFENTFGKEDAIELRAVLKEIATAEFN